MTDMKTHSGLRDLAGSYPDEVSLLTKIGQQFFQCVPEFDYVEQEL